MPGAGERGRPLPGADHVRARYPVIAGLRAGHGHRRAAVPGGGRHASGAVRGVPSRTLLRLCEKSRRPPPAWSYCAPRGPFGLPSPARFAVGSPRTSRKPRYRTWRSPSADGGGYRRALAVSTRLPTNPAIVHSFVDTPASTTAARL